MGTLTAFGLDSHEIEDFWMRESSNLRLLDARVVKISPLRGEIRSEKRTATVKGNKKKKKTKTNTNDYPDVGGKKPFLTWKGYPGLIAEPGLSRGNVPLF